MQRSREDADGEAVGDRTDVGGGGHEHTRGAHADARLLVERRDLGREDDDVRAVAWVEDDQGAEGHHRGIASAAKDLCRSEMHEGPDAVRVGEA